MKNKKKLIVFNWKLYPASLNEAKKLFLAYGKGGKKSEVVIAPPFVYLPDLAGLISKTRSKLGVSAVAKTFGGLHLASQNCFWENQGAFTGEISPAMLKNLGVEYVIIGHSERRQNLNETDEMINKKVLAALRAGLKVILCVGDPAERGLTRTSPRRWRGRRGLTRNLKSAEKYIKTQLQKNLFNLKQFNNSTIQQLFVAYEPVWAISSSKNSRQDTPEDAVEMSAFIKKTLNSLFKIHNSPVLYGGSVNSKDILDFIKHKEIDGVLVGHASVKKEEVKKLIKILNK